jgi:hypothetical protein
VGGKGLEEMRDGGRRCLSQANALQTIYALFEGTDGFLKGTTLFPFAFISSLSVFFQCRCWSLAHIITRAKSIQTGRPRLYAAKGIKVSVLIHRIVSMY